NSADRDRAGVAWRNLFAAFEAALRLLHPVMPFLTEELWHQLPQKAGAKSIALERYPEARPEWRDAHALAAFALVQEVVTAGRAIRAELKLDKKRVAAQFSSANPAIRETVAQNLDGILRLALLAELTISGEKVDQAGGGVRSTSEFDIRIAYAEAVDAAARLAQLKKEHDRLSKDIASKERQLSDETFRSRAPEKIIHGLEATLTERRIELAKTAERLSLLGTAG